MERTLKQGNSTNGTTTNKGTSIIEHIKQDSIVLDKSNSIFNYSTTKKEDSYICDFIHGNSLIFGKCRKTVLDESDSYYLFNKQGDSAEHQLFHCSRIIDEHHKDFTNTFAEPLNYLNDVIAPNKDNSQQQKLFLKDKVKLILKHHDTILDEIM